MLVAQKISGIARQLLRGAIHRITITRKQLSAAIWTLLYVAARNVELAFLDRTVTAGMVICTPIICFFAVPNSGELFVIKQIVRNLLRFLYLLLPFLTPLFRNSHPSPHQEIFTRAGGV